MSHLPAIWQVTHNPLLFATGVGGYVRSYDLLEDRQDLSRFRVPFLHRLLGKHEIVVNPELKGAPGAGDQIQIFDDVLIITQQFVRHTDGARCVISRDTIL